MGSAGDQVGEVKRAITRPDILRIMTKIRDVVRFVVAAAMVPLITVQPPFAWGRDGHMMINRLAGAALPTDVPEFSWSKDALDALEYYGPEPDRWKSPGEPELNAAQSPDHFLDMEYADLVGEFPATALRTMSGRWHLHRSRTPDLPLSPEKVGMQPYQSVEVWERLKSAMRDYRKLKADHKDTKSVENEIVFLAGWLGHYVADGSQPLHTTIQYNGWTGPNPNGYTTEHKIHALFESTFVSANIKAAEVAPLIPAKPVVLGDVFTEYMAYLRHSNTLIEKTYQLEKAGAFA